MPQPAQKASKPSVVDSAKKAVGKETKPTVPTKEKKKKVMTQRELKYPYYKVLICSNNPTPEEQQFRYKNDPFAEGIDADTRAELLADEKNRIYDIEYDGPITADFAKMILEYETEPDYVKRKLAQDPNYKESKLKFGSEFLFKDADGNKVVCWANCTNRPFDLTHANELAQDILTKNWKVNCENIIIGRTGLVISGQHRLIGLIRAVEQWRQQPHWQEIWETEPVIESMVAFGCSEDPKVIRTIDNVKPRTLGDVFYTSPLFADKSQSEKNELSKMLAYAVELLWKRTGGGRKMDKGKTGGDGDQFITYMTHSAAIDFQERHSKLLACVKHIFDEDGGKKPEIGETEEGKEPEIRGKVISGVLKMQRGHAAALMYLMAQSKTSEEQVDDYYAPGATKTERRLNWDHWDKACQFWSELAAQELEWTETVKEAIYALNDPEEGFEGNVKEKCAIIVKAWLKYKLKEAFKYDKPELLHPTFTIDETSNRRKIKPADEPVTGGIDRGTSDDEQTDTTALTKAQVEEEKDKARAEQIKKHIGKGQPPVVKASPDKKTLPSGTPVKPTADNNFGRDANNKVIKTGKTPAKTPVKKPLRAGTSNDPVPF